MTARRKAPGKRWSARSTTELYGATGARLPETATAGVAKVVVRWRLDGKNRKETFKGRGALGAASALQGLLAAAYQGDWEADDRGRPLPPGTAPVPPAGPTSRKGSGAGGNQGGTVRRRRRRFLAPPQVPPGGALSAPRASAAQAPRDVEELAAWFVSHVRSTQKRRGGGKRSPTTTMGYEKTLAFFTSIAIYRPGDPRLELPGVRLGAPMRIDDPDAGITPEDLVNAIGIRQVTDLRVRGANERAMKRWAQEVAKEERLAADENREAVLPPAPEMRPEAPNARTIEEFCRAVKAMFVEAHRWGKIAYQPWTATVDAVVVHAGPIRYTTRNVASRSQVLRLAAEMARYERATTGTKGKRTKETGERYEAMVLLAGIKGPRPEETIAIRDSWVKLDGDDPKIVLYGAEVYHPVSAPGGGRERARVVLKHRPEGSVRVLHLRGEPELVAKLRDHRARFVEAPDGTSDDPERRDPHFFTTHLGQPIDLSNWNPKWWKPVVERAMSHPDESHLSDMPFRRLRAAAITHWLTQGKRLYWCAMEAGNSPMVIEAHYAGVLQEVGYDPDGGDSDAPPSSVGRLSSPADLAALLEGADVVALAELLAAARDALKRRMGQDGTETL